jgi:hypothetical protein
MNCSKVFIICNNKTNIWKQVFEDGEQSVNFHKKYIEAIISLKQIQKLLIECDNNYEALIKGRLDIVNEERSGLRLIVIN